MSDLEKQLEEFESLQNIYDHNKLSFNQSTIKKLQSITVSNSDANKHRNLLNLKFTFTITKDLLIDCTLPSSYPSQEPPIVFIRASSTLYSKSSIKDANHLLKSRIDQAFEPDNPLLFDLFDWIETNIPSVIVVANFNSNTKPIKMRTFNLQRSFIWFHHINRKAKRTDQVAKQYGLTGFCVTGKPGVIVAEGLAQNVNHFVTDLKSWSWKRMIVRHTDNEMCENEQMFETKRRYKKWIFKHIQMHAKGGMKEVYDLLKEADLEHYYKSIVHINTPIDCNMNSDACEENKQDNGGKAKHKRNKKRKRRNDMDI